MTIEVCKSTIDKFWNVLTYVIVYGLVIGGTVSAIWIVDYALSSEIYETLLIVLIISILDIYGWYIIISDLNDHFKLFRIIPCDETPQQNNDKVSLE